MSTQSDGMDISRVLDVADLEDKGIEIHVRDSQNEPLFTKDGKKVTIRVAGTYSSRYRKAQAHIRESQVKRRLTKLTGEAINAQQTELVALCIIEWFGFRNGDTPFPCTKENAVLLLNRAPWIRDQVEEAMGDHAGFTESSSIS